MVYQSDSNVTLTSQANMTHVGIIHARNCTVMLLHSVHCQVSTTSVNLFKCYQRDYACYWTDKHNDMKSYANFSLKRTECILKNFQLCFLLPHKYKIGTGADTVMKKFSHLLTNKYTMSNGCPWHNSNNFGFQIQ
jgi:hypothetical protein